MNISLSKITAAVVASATLFTIGAVLFLYSQNTPAAETSDPNFTIEDRTLVDKKRVSRTDYEYTYTVDMANDGPDVSSATVTVSSTSPHTTIVDGELSFDEIASGTVATSTDTFTIRQNRRYPFDPEALDYAVDATSSGTRIIIAGGELSLVVPEGMVAQESINYSDEGDINTNISEPSTFTDENHGNLGLGIVIIDLANPKLQANLGLTADSAIYDYIASVSQLNHPDVWQRVESIGGRDFLLTYDVATGRIDYATRIDEHKILYVVSGEQSSLTEEDIQAILATIDFNS